MWTVKVKNILNSRKYAGEFKTELEASEWIAEQEANKSWGKRARQAVRDQDVFDESLVLSEFEDTDINGTTRTIVSLKAEYEFEVSDLNASIMLDTSDGKEARNIFARDKLGKWKIFVEFGKNVQLLFTELINDRGYTSAKKNEVMALPIVAQVMGQLSFGRIGEARKIVETVVADEDLFYADDIAMMKLFMDDFLADYTP